MNQESANSPFTKSQNPAKRVPETINHLEKIQKLEFKVVTINGKNQTISKVNRQTDLLLITLGKEIPLEMVLIPRGSFEMGSLPLESKDKKDERPQHNVNVSAFWMGKYTITQAQWNIVASWKKINHKLTADVSKFKGDNLPIESVSWHEVVEFCNRLSQNLNRTFRLPSEAEWEYACRAGTETPFHFGTILLPELANYDAFSNNTLGIQDTKQGQTTEVGSFKVANEFGLYDMHGNVMEWCQDHWYSNYDGAPNDGGEWIMKAAPASQVMRGGSWNRNSWDCRSASRHNYGADDKDSVIGFRVVCSV